MKPRVLLSFLMLSLLAAPPARAGLFFHRPRSCPQGNCPNTYRVPYDHPADPAREARYKASHTFARAGDPQCISPHAEPSYTGVDNGYTVGGGSLRHLGGHPRCPEEGTWGWDYVGGHLPRHVFLQWNHGRRVQAGTGAYKTDGPEVPDIFAAKPLRALGH